MYQKQKNMTNSYNLYRLTRTLANDNTIIDDTKNTLFSSDVTKITKLMEIPTVKPRAGISSSFQFFFFPLTNNEPLAYIIEKNGL